MKVLWFIYPFCGLFIIVGVSLCVLTLRGILKARSLSDWPTTSAEVVDCELVSKSDSEGGTSYEVKVSYRYTINGQHFTGTKIHPAYSSSSFDGHHQLYDKLDAAKVVQIHYNDAAPSESYLLAGMFSAHWASFFGGMIFASTGLFFLLTFHFAFAGNSDYAAALKVIQ